MDTDWTSQWTPPPQDLPEISPETLAAVIELQGGEVQESTRHLFETFEPELNAYFRRHSCQDDEADDLTQTVFIQMLEQIETLKDPTSFHFWLFKIAGNYLRNFMRDGSRSQEGFEDLADKARGESESSAFWMRGSFEPNPEVKLTMSETVDERRVTLRKFLRSTKLGSQTRESLLRRFQGESHEEIGRALKHIETALRLGTLIESHAPDAGPQLGEWLRPWLREGETLPDFTLVLELPARMIAQAGHRVRESQAQLSESGNHENEARGCREQTAAVLRRKLMEIRQFLMALFGSRHTAKLLGFEGATAKTSQPTLLLSQSEALLKVLRDPKRLAIPNTAYFDPVSAAATLEPPIVAFREAHGQFEKVRQAKAIRCEAGNHKWAELVHGIQCVVRVFSGWFHLIGRPDLVKKILPRHT